jgi:hypothetical protein
MQFAIISATYTLSVFLFEEDACRSPIYVSIGNLLDIVLLSMSPRLAIFLLFL